MHCIFYTLQTTEYLAKTAAATQVKNIHLFMYYTWQCVPILIYQSPAVIGRFLKALATFNLTKLVKVEIGISRNICTPEIFVLPK